MGVSRALAVRGGWTLPCPALLVTGSSWGGEVLGKGKKTAIYEVLAASWAAALIVALFPSARSHGGQRAQRVRGRARHSQACPLAVDLGSVRDSEQQVTAAMCML